MKDRIYLKNTRAQIDNSQTGVGPATLDWTPTRLTQFTLDTRAREVLRIKRVKLFYSVYLAAAAYAFVFYSQMGHSSRAKDYGTVPRPSNLVLNIAQFISDSYAYYSSFETALVTPPTFDWPDGFEPTFTEAPYWVSVLEVKLNAGLFKLHTDIAVDFWIDKVSEKEYEKLRLQFGELG